VTETIASRGRSKLFPLLYILAIAWTVWPIAVLLITNLVAHALHCRLSEGGPSPCVLYGHDISQSMYIGAVSFWYALTTVPTGVPLLSVIALGHLAVSVWKRRR
jgi:hypothetical protein